MAPRGGKSSSLSSKSGADLQRHLKYCEKYGSAGGKELANGRFRYYREMDFAKKPGEMAGRRYVHEFNPVNGSSRGWHETLDHAGKVRQVRPELNNGVKYHYTFDRQGNYAGGW